MRVMNFYTPTYLYKLSDRTYTQFVGVYMGTLDVVEKRIEMRCDN